MPGEHAIADDQDSAALVPEAVVARSRVTEARITVVDDEIINCKVVRKYLDLAGYQRCTIITDATTVLDAFQQEPPDVVLLDVMMPEVSGLQILQQMRTDERLAHTPVVILTALDDDETKRRALQLGATDFLPKPVNPNDLIPRVRNAVVTGLYHSHLRDNAELLARQVRQKMQELHETNERLKTQINERVIIEDMLRHNAYHDSLTGLPNRRMLVDQLNQAIERAKRHPEHGFALLFLDIDNFKVINDSLGHSFGDALLVEVASRIGSSQRVLDTLSRAATGTTARLGGDEFVILLDGIKQPGDAVAVAERIQAALRPPISLSGHDATISASIGIATGRIGSGNAESILREADTAMYRAKQAGKSQHALFDATMHVQAQRRLELENALRKALDRDEFVIQYQPVIDLHSGRISSLEALVRWVHPTHGVLPPGEFIPIAEELGLINELGRHVLHASCRELAIWNRETCSASSISINVNVSPRQLAEPAFIGQVQQALEQHGIPPAWLNVEITESAIIGGSRAVEQTLTDLKEIGLQLHMDDFGTGYSSLSLLHRFPFDVLKIDRAFVANLQESREYAAVVHAIITLARNLDMRVTAEGLETQEQLVQILALDCNYGQGYFFAKPLDPSAAAALLRSDPPWLHCLPKCDPRWAR